MCFPSHNAVHQLHQTSLQKIVQLDSRRITGSTGRGWEAVTGVRGYKQGRGWEAAPTGVGVIQGRGWEAVTGFGVINKVAAGKPLRVSGL